MLIDTAEIKYPFDTRKVHPSRVVVLLQQDHFGVVLRFVVRRGCVVVADALLGVAQVLLWLPGTRVPGIKVPFDEILRNAVQLATTYDGLYLEKMRYQ